MLNAPPFTRQAEKEERLQPHAAQHLGLQWTCHRGLQGADPSDLGAHREMVHGSRSQEDRCHGERSARDPLHTSRYTCITWETHSLLASSFTDLEVDREIL